MFTTVQKSDGCFVVDLNDHCPKYDFGVITQSRFSVACQSVKMYNLIHTCSKR